MTINCNKYDGAEDSGAKDTGVDGSHMSWRQQAIEGKGNGPKKYYSTVAYSSM